MEKWRWDFRKLIWDYKSNLGLNREKAFKLDYVPAWEREAFIIECEVAADIARFGIIWVDKKFHPSLVPKLTKEGAPFPKSGKLEFREVFTLDIVPPNTGLGKQNISVEEPPLKIPKLAPEREKEVFMSVCDTVYDLVTGAIKGGV